MADQLIIYCALAEGKSEYIIPYTTEHIQTNMWLVEKILRAKCDIKNNILSIEGIGFTK